MSRLLPSLTFIFLISCITACTKKSEEPAPVTPQPVIKAAIATLTIIVTGDLSKAGNTAKATVVAKDASGNTISDRGTPNWSVVEPSILTISPDGNITTLKAGSTDIIVTLENVTARYTVQVGTPQTELSVALGCNCEIGDFTNTGAVTFSQPIMKPEDLAYILPLGYMYKGHVTPIDHQYYYPPDVLLGASAPEKNVYSPADGYIVKVSRAPLTAVESHLTPRDGYDLYIQHNCKLYTFLGLLSSLPSDIAASIGTIARGETKNVKVKVTAGQVVARVGGQSLDLSVFYQDAAEKQWIVPSHYTEVGKKWKVDPFVFYTDAIRNSLYTKTLRTVNPVGGRFDYDIDGKLAGSWFLQGTNGYDGIPGQGNDYWRGHIVFAYNAMDPGKIEISIGRWNKAGATDDEIKAGWQFTVTGNTPDPKDVGIASGIVKYEVTDFSYVLTNNPAQSWGGQTYEGAITPKNQSIAGVILAQLTANRTLKLECFPGKTAAEVSGFTANAQLYER